VAYQNIKTPLVTKNGISYNLQYDLRTGNAQIIQQNAPAGTRPIYQDGSWNSSATSLGFTENEKNQLHTQTIISVQAAYRTAGGVNSGGKLGQWAAENFTTGTPGQTSITPANRVSGTTTGLGGRGTRTGTTTGTGTGTSGTTSGTNNPAAKGGGLGELFGFLQNPKESFETYAVNGGMFGMKNEESLFGKGQKMTYPEDLMTSQQDHFAITMYSYRPSKADAIFGGTAAAVQTLTSGLQTVTNLEGQGYTVFLPMPNSVTDSNNVSWGEDSMSNIAAALAAQTMADLKGNAVAAGLAGGATTLLGGSFSKGAAAALLTKNLKALEQGLANSGGGAELGMLLGTEGVSRLLKLQGQGVEPESILARGAGIVPNSNLELLFNSPTLRSFTFSYRLSPRSVEEAQVVRRIIRFFKQGMAAKKMSGKSGQASFFLGTPNVFKLEYRTRGTNEIPGVNKFKTCALTSFGCNFTPDGLWAAYDKGQPVSTTMQMTFNELEPIYDTDYQAGNIFENRSDLSSVSSNSIGY